MAKKVAIIGAGSWGTAVAIHLAKSGSEVLLWAHSPAHITMMEANRCNERYLPAIHFPSGIKLFSDLDNCINSADYVILAVPSHAFAEVLEQMTKPAAGIGWLTKGLDPNSNHLLHSLVAQKWGNDYPLGIISGPSFAKELAAGLPTAVTLAGNCVIFQKELQTLLHKNNLRVYLSNDLLGVQLAGAIKNVLAIACGISDGLNYGANAKAALITRGLSEMRRLGKAIGARDETFMGLAGVGDLVLTCTDNQSRNRRFGLFLGQGMTSEKAEENIGQVVEGKNNAAQVCLLAEQNSVEMPICTQVHQLLLGKLNPEQAVVNLMSRSARLEE